MNNAIEYDLYPFQVVAMSAEDAKRFAGREDEPKDMGAPTYPGRFNPGARVWGFKMCPDPAVKPRTWQQAERQRTRENGRYTKLNPCEICDKSAGADYYSIPWVDEPPFSGCGLVLCKRCEKKCETREDAIRLLGLEVLP